VGFADFRTFLEELERRGQLKRIAVEVDPDLEVTEITARVSRMPAAGLTEPPATDPIHGRYGGYALLFERPKGSDVPLAMNVFGSYPRICLALGCDDLEELAGRLEALLKPEIPTSLLQKLQKLPELVRISSYAPRLVRSGICQQKVRTEDVDILSLPIIKCWPKDAAKYITLGIVVTKDPDDGTVNLGLYRLQVLGPNRTAVHWQMHHDGARNWRKYASRGKPMPVAVVFGGQPVLTYAASAPLPPGLSELLFAGLLNGEGIELVPCRTVPLEVPANAEIVLEGWVRPGETVAEGPFGDHTGFYSATGEYPVFTVTAITSRAEPIYPATVVGRPPMEDYYLGKATERIFLPVLKMLVPEVLDYHLPMFGVFHNCAFVKIRKEYPYQARKVMHALWGLGQMCFTKFLIIVDQDVDVHDEQDVLFHMCANVDPRRDVCVVDGPVDVLDHASPYCGTGSKIGIDATRKLPGEGLVRPWPERIEMSPEIKRLVTERWGEYGIE